MREWSAEGEPERVVTFRPLIEALKKHLPPSDDTTGVTPFSQRVAVPGCGLGRLPVELAAEGYSVEGNEFSVYMLLASNFILNCVTKSHAHEIAPFVNRFGEVMPLFPYEGPHRCAVRVCNVVNVSDPMRVVQIPDRTAAEILEAGPFGWPAEDTTTAFPRFAMAAGDFTKIYGAPDQREQWHGLVTCFFMDTAPVVVE